MPSIDTWKFLAGLGLFLYGLTLMEQVTKRIAGRPFKLFLRSYTKSLLKAIVGGTFITGIIQSSSVVILMLMSFVSAGIISFRNAFGVLIGSNLGSTVDSWFLATIGFKFNLLAYSLPIIAVTAIAMFFSEKRKQLYDTLYFLFSIGILLLGFGFMKDGAGQLVVKFNIAAYGDSNLFFIVLAGVIITVLLQSSAATVAVALTALHAHALAFPAAAAVIIGSEVGTTIKILFSSIKSSPGSRMLAWGDFVFNVFTAVISYLLLFPIIFFIQQMIGIKDPLVGLVFFQSFINLLAIILFLPLIRPCSKWLENYFSKVKNGEENEFDRNLPPIPELVPGVMQKAAGDILQRVLEFHKRIFGIDMQDNDKGFFPAWRSFTRVHGATNFEYAQIKQMEGDYLKYYSGLNEANLTKEAYNNVNRFLSSIRESIHAAKSVHDIRQDLITFQTSANNYLFQQGGSARLDWVAFNKIYLQLFNLETEDEIKKELVKMKASALDQYSGHKKETAQALYKQEIVQIDASTLLNVYQEMFSSKKALLRALAYLKLNNRSNGQEEFSI